MTVMKMKVFLCSRLPLHDMESNSICHHPEGALCVSVCRAGQLRRAGGRLAGCAGRPGPSPPWDKGGLERAPRFRISLLLFR